MIRLIAMDMDGTLLNSARQVSRANAAALRRVQEAGIHLALCSGRSPGYLALIAIQNGLKDCALLALNGLYCQRDLNEPCVIQHVLTEEALRGTLRFLREEQQLFGCYAQNRLVIFPLNGQSHLSFFDVQEGHALSTEVLYGEESLSSLTDGVNKIITFAPDTASWERTQHKLLQVPDLEVTTSWPLNFELMPKGYGKGTAVAELAAQLHLTADEVMTIGDYDNDESMIRWAGMGVAMANATDCIKSAAQLITLDNDHDGVAYAIENYALKQA